MKSLKQAQQYNQKKGKTKLAQSKFVLLHITSRKVSDLKDEAIPTELKGKILKITARQSANRIFK